jgi:NhaP-type Na+/H+ and K+/H+ antiporter
VLLPRPGGLGESIPPHQKSLYALGAAFAIYGVTVLPPHGNGFIAVYVAAIVLGIRRADVRAAFEQRSADIVEILKLGIFAVFGSLLTFSARLVDGAASVAIVLVTLLVARPVAVWLSLVGTGFDAAAKWFMAWFGPKGIATMTFSLLVLSRGIEAGQEIFDLAALVVLVSIIAHGLTDTPGVSWLARREQ